jgi:hypothetical protein
MPIKGIMSAMLYQDRLETMVLDQIAYIDARDFILTRKAVFLDFLTPIIREEDFYDELREEYVQIKRIGAGLSGDDFEVDVSILENFEFLLEGEYMYNHCMKESAQYIIFFEPTFEITQSINFPQEETLESLKRKLAEAVSANNYELAATLRDEIATLEQK